MKNGFLDVFLLPKHVYKKISDKKASLYAGILFIGIVDIGFSFFDSFTRVFGSKPQTTLTYNVGLALLFAVMLGFIDVLFFTMPMFDVFKFIKKGKIGAIQSTLVKFTKVYITAHLVTVPFNLVSMLLYMNIYKSPNINSYSESIMLILVLFSYFIMPAWFSGIIARGTNVIFNIEQRFKPFVFACIFTWNFLLGNYALSYIIDHWILIFFK